MKSGETLQKYGNEGKDMKRRLFWSMDNRDEIMISDACFLRQVHEWCSLVYNKLVGDTVERIYKIWSSSK